MAKKNNSEEVATGEDKVVDLRKRVICKVLKKGHDYKHNKWKEGQEIIVGAELAKSFEERELVKIIGNVEPNK